MPNCMKCKNKFPNILEIDGKKRNLKNRKFCIECSPFNKHNTKNLLHYDSDSKRVTKQCSMCKELKNIDEYYLYDKHSAYCKKCYNIKTRIRQSSFKEKCVDYKGGSCISCGYKKCTAALEFHHRVPETKKFSIVHAWTKGFKQEVIEELDKCDLLCANCHRETHYLKECP